MQVDRRDAQQGNGMICRKEGVREQRAVAGLVKEKGPSRVIEESSRGIRSAQAMYLEGSGTVGGVNKTRGPNSIMPSLARENLCHKGQNRLVGSGREASSGCLPKK